MKKGDEERKKEERHFEERIDEDKRDKGIRQGEKGKIRG